MFEQTFIRIMRGLAPSCVLYAKLFFNGVCEFLLRILKEETTASGQAEKQLTKQLKRKKGWVTSMLHKLCCNQGAE